MNHTVSDLFCLHPFTYVFEVHPCCSMYKNTIPFYGWILYLGLPQWLSSKESTCRCRRRGFDPWVRKIPWRKTWQPTRVLQENPMDRGAWWATVHRVPKSQTWLKQLTTNYNIWFYGIYHNFFINSFLRVVLAIVNSAALNINVKEFVSVSISALLGLHLGMEFLGWSNSMLTFRETGKRFA